MSLDWIAPNHESSAARIAARFSERASETITFTDEEFSLRSWSFDFLGTSARHLSQAGILEKVANHWSTLLANHTVPQTDKNGNKMSFESLAEFANYLDTLSVTAKKNARYMSIQKSRE